jgi:hypothetical protein
MRHQMDAIIARRGNAARNIKVAAARTLLTLVFYGLRDGEIRAREGRRVSRPRHGRREIATILPAHHGAAWHLIDPVDRGRTAPCNPGATSTREPGVTKG